MRCIIGFSRRAAACGSHLSLCKTRAARMVSVSYNRSAGPPERSATSLVDTTPNDRDKDDSNRAAISRQLDSAGWVLVWSETLAEAIVVTRDASIRASLPDAYRGSAVYLCEEVASLVGVCPEDLRVLHAIKKAFGGRILRQPPDLSDEVAARDAASREVVA